MRYLAPESGRMRNNRIGILVAALSLVGFVLPAEKYHLRSESGTLDQRTNFF